MVLDISNPDTVDAKKEFGIDEIITKLTDGLFGILFVTNKHTDHNLFAHFLEIFIDHMQDLAFPLSFVLAPWSSSVTWLQTVLNWFSPERLIGKNQVLFFILLTLIGGTLFNALWVGYSFSQNNFRFIWTLKILRITLGLFATILFIPILAFFAENVAECSDGVQEVSCFTGDNLFKSIITLVFSIFFIFLALAVKATFFDSDPKRSDITGRPHSRLDIVYTAFRGILTILSIVLPAWVHNSAETLSHHSATTVSPTGTTTTSATNTVVSGNVASVSKAVDQIWIMTAACVLLSGILAFGHIWYIPYYNYRYSILRAGMNVNFFWASLCLFFTVLRPYSDIGIIYLVFCPITFVLGYYFVQFRRYMVEKTPLSAINDPFTLELKIRFRLMEAGMLFKGEHGKPNTVACQFGRSPGDIASPTTGPPGLNASASRDSEAKLAEQAKAAEHALLDEINDMFVHAAKILPKSCMLHLFTASFQLNYLGNRAQCLAVTAKAALMNPQLDEAFMIFKRQRLLNDKFGGGDVIDFIAYEQNLKLAKLNERKATIAGVQFWSELMKRHPSFHKLQSHGAAISTAISLAQIHFTTLLKLSPDSPGVYRMYGRFLINALNDKKNGQDLLDHADEIEEEAERENGAEDDDDDDGDGDGSDRGNVSDFDGSGMSLEDKPPPKKEMNINLFSEDNCVITISGERHNIGCILSMNAKANKLFGYKKGETVGRNITLIIPSPFAEAHDGYLHKYLDTGFAKIIDRSRQVLGLHKEGHLLPMILCVKHAVDQQGKQSFIGVIKPAKASATAGFIIFNADDLKIKYTTLNIEEAFNFQASQANVFMGEIFPGLDTTTLDQVSSGGYQTETKAENNITLSVKIAGEKIVVQGHGLYIVRAVFKPMQTKSTSLSNLQTYLQTQTQQQHQQQSDQQMHGLHEASSEEMDPNAMPMVFSAHNSQDNLAASEKVPSIDGNFSDNENVGIKTGGGYSGSGDFSGAAAAATGRPSVTTKKLALRKLQMLDNAERKSDQRSESSFSKASSSRNVKRIISEKNNTSNKHLMFIQLTYILCMLVLSIDAIYEDFAFVNVYTAIRVKIDNLNARLQSALYVAQISDSARSLDLHRINWVSKNQMTCAESIPGAQQHIQNNTQYIKSMLNQFLEVKGTTSLINNSGLPIYTTLNFEAINLFLSAAKYAAQANVTDSQMAKNVQFILDNGPTVIMNIMNQSAVMQRDEYMIYTQYQPDLFISTAIFAPVFAFVLIFAVIFPIYYHIEKYRNRFLSMFCDIPKDVVKGIHDSHLKRLMDAQEEDEENEDKENHGARLAIDNLILHSENGDDPNELALNVIDSGTSNSPGTVGRSTFRVSTAFQSFFQSNHRIGIYSLVMVFLSIVYFLTLGTLSHMYVTSMQSAATSTFWTLQRSIYSTLTIFGVREQFLGALQLAGWSNTANMSTTLYSDLLGNAAPLLNEFADAMNWMDYSRLYGDPIMATPPLVLLGDSVPHVYIEVDNGCPNTISDPVDCPSFMNGVLLDGLHAGMEWLEDTVFHISNIQMGDNPAIVTAVVGFADMTVTNLRKLNSEYLTPNIKTSSEMFWQSWQSSASSFSIFQITFTCCYILALLLLYIFVIRIMLKNMSQEMRRTSALVHMLPTEILTTVPSFKAWAAEMGIKSSRPQSTPGQTPGQTPGGHIAHTFDNHAFSEKIQQAKAEAGKAKEKERGIQFQEHSIHIAKTSEM